ncbi:hypothetical protein [Actinomycetospora soli]|uniref:hypothetical protein n=1 Tax=Actinomycetospora soli TaxID=2893887 RepID=UPI001E35BD58|nr:hypothetical protein [Actinomycetospora soli]MCD2190451.1 hypothetical protein [Actinomycetospora soli]
MDTSTARTLLPTVSTVLVVAAGALATRALHVGVPAVLVAALALTLLLVVAAAGARWCRATRRRDDPDALDLLDPLDAEWAAVEPRWRDRSQ